MVTVSSVFSSSSGDPKGCHVLFVLLVLWKKWDRWLASPWWHNGLVLPLNIVWVTSPSSLLVYFTFRILDDLTWTRPSLHAMMIKTFQITGCWTTNTGHWGARSTNAVVSQPLIIPDCPLWVKWMLMCPYEMEQERWLTTCSLFWPDWRYLRSRSLSEFI